MDRRRLRRRAGLVHPAGGPVGRALRLDFDLAGTAGYALARRALPLDLPANYEIVFSMRGDAPVNHFQVKLVDASGENVWWFNRPRLRVPARMANGPDQEAPHRFRVGANEGPHASAARRPSSSPSRPVVAADGVVWKSAGSSCASSPDRPASRPAAIRVGLVLEPRRRPRAGHGRLRRRPRGRATPAAGAAQVLTVDFHQPREFGGLIVRWLAGGPCHALRRRVLRRRRGVATPSAGRGRARRISTASVARSPRRAFCAWSCTRGPRGDLRPRRDRGQAVWPSARRRTPSSRRSLGRPRAARIRAGCPASSPLDPRRYRRRRARAGCCRRTARSRYRGAGSRSSRSSWPAAGSSTWADVEARQSLIDGDLPIPGVTLARAAVGARV